MVRQLISKLSRRKYSEPTESTTVAQSTEKNMTIKLVHLDTKRAVDFLKSGNLDSAIKIGQNAANRCRLHALSLNLVSELGIPHPGRDPMSYPISPTLERLEKLRKFNGRNGLPTDEKYLHEQLKGGVKPEGYSQAELEKRLDWQAAYFTYMFVKSIERGAGSEAKHNAESTEVFYARIRQRSDWIEKANKMPGPAYHISDLAQHLGFDKPKSNTTERKRLAYILERAGWQYVRDGRRKVWRKPGEEKRQ